MARNLSNIIRIFFSYAHQDESWREELEKQLSILQLQGQVTFLHDRHIQAGQEWGREIDSYLNSADVILLLISPDFMASEYCLQVEVKRAMERYEAGEACVIPVILRPILWQEAPFGKLSALPTNAKPAALWDNRDQATLDIAEGIQKVVRQLLLGASPEAVKVDGKQWHQASQVEGQEVRMLDQFSQYERRRLQLEHDMLQDEWDTRNEKIRHIRKALAIENRPEEIFRLQYKLSDEEEPLTRLRQRLDTIERSLQ